jgi:hypothetical protein
MLVARLSVEKMRSSHQHEQGQFRTRNGIIEQDVATRVAAIMQTPRFLSAVEVYTKNSCA